MRRRSMTRNEDACTPKQRRGRRDEQALESPVATLGALLGATLSVDDFLDFESLKQAPDNPPMDPVIGIGTGHRLNHRLVVVGCDPPGRKGLPDGAGDRTGLLGCAVPLSDDYALPLVQQEVAPEEVVVEVLAIASNRSISVIGNRTFVSCRDAPWRVWSGVSQIGILDGASKRFDAGPPAVALGLEGEDVGQEKSAVRTRWQCVAGDHTVVEQPGEVLAGHAKDLGSLARCQHLVRAEHGHVVAGGDLLARSAQQPAQPFGKVDAVSSGIHGDERALQSRDPACGFPSVWGGGHFVGGGEATSTRHGATI